MPDAGKHRRPRHPAHILAVEIGEPQSPGGQPINVGSLDLASVAAEIRVAHVVGHDQDDVGRVFSSAGRREQRESGKEQGAEAVSQHVMSLRGALFHPRLL